MIQKCRLLWIALVGCSAALSGGCPDIIAPPGDPSVGEDFTILGSLPVFGLLTNPMDDARDSRDFADASVTDGGLSANVDVDGLVRLYTIGRTEHDAEVSLNGVSMAWSNDAHRLAVVARDVSRSEGQATKLLLLTTSLELLLEIPLELPIPESIMRPFAVSWADGDEKLAVSLDATQLIAQDGSLPAPRCLIIRPDQGRVESYELYNVYYVGRDDVVGTLPGSEVPDLSSVLFRVHTMQLTDGRIENPVLIEEAGIASASRPAAGLFGSIDKESRFLFSPAPPWRNFNIRTTDGRFRHSFRGSVAEKLVIIPKALALRVYPGQLCF